MAGRLEGGFATLCVVVSYVIHKFLLNTSLYHLLINKFLLNISFYHLLIVSSYTREKIGFWFRHVFVSIVP